MLHADNAFRKQTGFMITGGTDRKVEPKLAFNLFLRVSSWSRMEYPPLTKLSRDTRAFQNVNILQWGNNHENIIASL